MAARKFILAATGAASLGLTVAVAGGGFLGEHRLDQEVCWVAPLERLEAKGVIGDLYALVFKNAPGEITPGETQTPEIRVAAVCDKLDCAIDAASALLEERNGTAPQTETYAGLTNAESETEDDLDPLDVIVIADVLRPDHFILDDETGAFPHGKDDLLIVGPILLDDGPGLLVGGFFPFSGFGGAPAPIGGPQTATGPNVGGTASPTPTVSFQDPNVTGNSDPNGGGDPMSDDTLVTPLPAAFWLMGPALLGLRAASRRKRRN